MALEGSLKEFGLADILQLLYFQKKTGVLNLQGRSDKIRLIFHEGNIIGAESRKRSTDSRLGNVLIRRGIVSEEAMRTAAEKHKAEGIRLGVVLIRDGHASKGQVNDVLVFQLTETLGQVFTWTEGRYDFTPQDIPIDKTTGVSLDTQHFLMEGLRLVDEWSEIKDRISVDTIFVRTDIEPLEISAEQMEVLNLIDGISAVSDISDVAGKDSFSVSRILLSLMEQGLVVEKIAEQAPEEESKAAKVKKPIPALPFLLLASMIAVFLASSMFSYLSNEDNIKQQHASGALDRIRYDILITKESKGAYPITIAESDPWGNRYIYKTEGNTFLIKSAGPDRTPQTQDDIY